MADALTRLLETRDWLLADGATGTNLFNAGLSAGDAPELWNETNVPAIQALYRGSVEAGSDLFLTNTFGSNRARLKLHDSGHRSRELSRMGAEIGREIADQAGRPVIVAGSMGPTGEIMAPMGPLTHADAVEIFHEQAEGLKEGGADVLWVETISAPEEMKAAAEAAEKAGMPWCITMSFDTAGRTMMGTTAAEMSRLVARMSHAPLAFGANCGVGASDLIRTVMGLSGDVLIAKGNAGIPKYVDGHIHYDGTPDLMAEYAVIARDAGATIIGGCCGTMPDHLRKMREALETRPRGEKPDLAHVAATLGGFSSDSDGSDGATAPKRERRGRRRPAA